MKIRQWRQKVLLHTLCRCEVKCAPTLVSQFRPRVHLSPDRPHFSPLGLLQPPGLFQVKLHPQTCSKSPPTTLPLRPLTVMCVMAPDYSRTKVKPLPSAYHGCWLPKCWLLLSCFTIHSSCSSTKKFHLCCIIWSCCIWVHLETIPQGDKLSSLWNWIGYW